MSPSVPSSAKTASAFSFGLDFYAQYGDGDEGFGDEPVVIGNCTVVASPVWGDPAQESCSAFTSCDVGVLVTPSCESETGGNPARFVVSPSETARGFAPSAIAGVRPARSLGYSVWSGDEPPAELRTLYPDIPFGGLSKYVQWAFLEPAVGYVDQVWDCDVSAAFPWSIAAAHTPLWLASALLPFAVYHVISGVGGESRDGSVLTRVRIYVGAMHFPMLLPTYGETSGPDVGSNSLSDLQSPFHTPEGRAYGFMCSVRYLAPFVTRGWNSYLDSASGATVATKVCSEAVRTARYYPCGGDPDYLDGRHDIIGDGNRVPVVTFHGEYAVLTSALSYQYATSAYTPASASALPGSEAVASSAFGRMQACTVDVWASPEWTDDEVAAEAFRCVFGSRVEVGIELEFNPASVPGCVSKVVSKLCLDLRSDAATFPPFRLEPLAGFASYFKGLATDFPEIFTMEDLRSIYDELGLDFGAVE